ncbi:MAG TPA: PAC2 family protein [Actinomycetota bacterium]|nr:PAC2 family protein [Actinomycetota bacterium]
MADPIIWHDKVPLRSPILVAAFRGWNDAGEAATFAAQHLCRVWDAQKIGEIDPEEFYDFQAVRPQVRLVDGITREITWPGNEFWAVTLDSSPHDVLLMIGTEPNTRWKKFSSAIVDVARSYDVQLVLTFGALLADVPHSRPVHITGTAVSQHLIDKLSLQRSRYEGPTGIVGVLHDAFAATGIDSASLWVAVPHYLAVSPNPKAALALVDRATELIGAEADVEALQRAAEAYEDRVSEIVASDEDIQSYVRMLEERADEREDEEQMDPTKLPSGDVIAAELEKFLRERSEGDS